MNHASPDAQGSPTGTNFMNELQFDEPTHTYTHNSVRLPSVTEIVRFAYPDAFADIPASNREFYFERGRQTHKLWEMVEEGTDGGFDFDAEVEKYRAGHTLFLKQTGFRVLPGGIERRVKNLELGYAGTLDRIGTIPNRVVLLDYKTSKVVDKPVALQTALYLLAIPGFKFPEVERYGVAFTKDGKYQMSRRYPDSDADDARYWAKKFKEAAK